MVWLAGAFNNKASLIEHRWYKWYGMAAFYKMVRATQGPNDLVFTSPGFKVPNPPRCTRDLLAALQGQVGRLLSS